MRALPSAVRKLDKSKVKTVNLSVNRLSAIPPEIPLLFSDIETLIVSHNFVRVLSTPFASQRQTLENLDLSRNSMEVIERCSIEGIVSLRVLTLSYNYLSRLPSGFLDATTALRELKLGSNRLVELPSFASLGALVVLDVSHNRLSQLPADIGSCRALQVLRAGSNALVALPAALGLCTRLQMVMVANNLLAYLPAEMRACKSLHEIDLAHNRFTDVPELVHMLPSLFRCSFEANALSALVIVDADAEEYAPMQGVFMANNAIASFSGEFDRWAGVATLDLSNNRLGVLPPAIGAMALLSTLLLAGNALVDVPAQLAELTALTDLDLSRNRLSALPAALLALPALRSLRVAHNEIRSVPPLPRGRAAHEIWPVLRELYAQYNRLVAVPAWWTALPSLAVLSLARNALDEIPDDLCRLVRLTRLSLRGNTGVRALPPLGALGELTELDIGYLSLTEIPTWIASISSLQHVSLRGNPAIASIGSSITAKCAARAVSLRVEGTAVTTVPSSMAMSASAGAGAGTALAGAGASASGTAGGGMLASSASAGALNASSSALLASAASSSSAAGGLGGLGSYCGVAARSLEMPVQWGLVDSIGGRGYMEDTARVAQIIVRATGARYSYFAVFDGHSGVRTAAWLGYAIASYIEAELNAGASPYSALSNALTRGAADVNAVSDGSTGSVVLWGEETLCMAAVGDSRVVVQLTADGIVAGLREHLDTAELSTTHTARRQARADTVRMSTDHNVNKMDRLEYDRIREAGGWVVADGYVNDAIAVSRSFGDAALKPIVPALPDIVEIDARHVAGFVLASDGLWDVVTDSMAIEAAVAAASCQDAAERLLERALLDRSHDNVTVIVAGAFIRYPDDELVVPVREPPAVTQPDSHAPASAGATGAGASNPSGACRPSKAGMDLASAPLDCADASSRSQRRRSRRDHRPSSPPREPLARTVSYHKPKVAESPPAGPVRTRSNPNGKSALSGSYPSPATVASIDKSNSTASARAIASISSASELDSSYSSSSSPMLCERMLHDELYDSHPSGEGEVRALPLVPARPAARAIARAPSGTASASGQVSVLAAPVRQQQVAHSSSGFPSSVTSDTGVVARSSAPTSTSMSISDFSDPSASSSAD